MKFKFAVFTLSLLIVLTMVPSAFAQEIQTRSEPSAIARANGFHGNGRYYQDRGHWQRRCIHTEH